ncbi:MAG: hypothetical protein LZF60_20037 [Nitrospira sp.]|nr:MAG: hypothetical protein LZF60_20037 [Nitrospira sp.]
MTRSGSAPIVVRHRERSAANAIRQPPLIPFGKIDDDLALPLACYVPRSAPLELGAGKDLQLRRPERRHHADGSAEGETRMHGRQDAIAFTSRRIHTTG